MKIVIIGGTGGMGKSLMRFFHSKKITTKAIGRATLTPAIHLRSADIVVISVPSRALSYAVNLLSGIDLSKKLIVSLGSIMTHDQGVLKGLSAPVLHLHQLFGPQVYPFTHQRMIVSGATKQPFSRFLLSLFKKDNVSIQVLKLSEHDKLMASVQALSQFSTISLGKTLSESGNSMKKLKNGASVTFNMSMEVICRIMAQKADLWAFLQFENPFALKVMEKHLKNVQLMINMAKNKDYKKFEQFFNKTAKFWIN
ncbi:MAG: prephenate dehydrogenase dimerization domain-containing protein [Patescibacteria group bacterium]